MKILKRMLMWGAIALGSLGLFVLLVNVWVVHRASDRIFEDVREVPARPVALLLGTSRYISSGYKNAFFFNRIDAAVSLYRSGKVRKIIVSGDNGTDGYNETRAMREELERRGVPSRDIVNDHAGFRTLDSVLRALSVFGQNEIVVVSQRFHVQRAIFIARAHGIDAVGFPAKDPDDSPAARRVLYREYLARVKAFLDCYILGTQPRFPGPPEPIRFN